MKNYRFFFLTMIFLAGSAISLNGQTKKFDAMFKTMAREQVNIAKTQKFTKAEITALEKVSKSSGNRLLKIVKASPGETNQYLVDKVTSEFRKLNTEYGKVLSGSKLTALKKLNNKNKDLMVKNLKSQYIDGAKGTRAGIRSNIRIGIRTTLLKGFGGQDLGNYFK